MARQARYCPPGMPLHVIQRGNDRQICFGSDEDRAAYIHWLSEAVSKYDVAVHAWILMNNHIHLLVTPWTDQAISRAIQHLGRHYVRYFNRKYGRTGTLYEGRFKSCLVENATYFLLCQRYIELNPVRAGMARQPSDYVWSSYRCNGLGLYANLWTAHPEYLALGKTNAERREAYCALFNRPMDDESLTDIRNSVNQGLALGSAQFKKEVEIISGRRLRLMKRGPKKKKKLKRASFYSDPK